MTERWPLRRRIIAAHVLLACVVCGAFAAAALHAIERVEDGLIDQRLARTADRYAQRQQQGLPMDLPPSVTLYAGESIPAVMRGLPAGKHEVTLGGTTVEVLVRGEGAQAFALTDDDADFEAIRGQLYALLAGSFAACIGLAVVLGRWTASRVIAPVTALAQAVAAERLPGQFPSLESKDEMGLLARAFAERTRTLQAVLAREQWFVADVSHELRTPLAVMLGAAEVLCAQTAREPAQQAVAERIRRTAADTAARVSALLLLSRAPESLDAPLMALAPLVRQEIERCQPLLQGKPVVLEADLAPEVRVRARPELAGTAIGNLLRNACLYTDSGHVRVQLSAGSLEIEDTGSGIPPALRERLFDRLVPEDGGSPTGSGLGLAIVRRVAEHLGWEVRLEASSAAGSRFVLTWPALVRETG